MMSIMKQSISGTRPDENFPSRSDLLKNRPIRNNSIGYDAICLVIRSTCKEKLVFFFMTAEEGNRTNSI